MMTTAWGTVLTTPFCSTTNHFPCTFFPCTFFLYINKQASLHVVVQFSFTSFQKHSIYMKYYTKKSINT